MCPNLTQVMYPYNQYTINLYNTLCIILHVSHSIKICVSKQSFLYFILGAIIGLNAALFQLARIVAPLLGGVIIHNYGFQYIGYLAGTSSLLLASIVYLGF